MEKNVLKFNKRKTTTCIIHLPFSLYEITLKNRGIFIKLGNTEFL